MNRPISASRVFLQWQLPRTASPELGLHGLSLRKHCYWKDPFLPWDDLIAPPTPEAARKTWLATPFRSKDMSSNTDTFEAATTAATLQAMAEDGDQQEEAVDDALIFDTSHDGSLRSLREIGSLASWTVSTHKPTCGTAALMAPSPHTFWQSDGPQPHLLTLHFFKLVKIVRLRVYLDFGLDESYTPTKMEFWGGWSSSYGLVQFAEWSAQEPRGWQEIGLEGCGVDGKHEVRCMVLQLRIIENHQNGKDTHLRGLQVFSRDERVRRGRLTQDVAEVTAGVNGMGIPGDETARQRDRRGVLDDLDWMEEPALR